MTVSRDLLELMACPLCGADLVHHPAEAAKGETIACTRRECGLVFSVKDDIPVMLIDEADRRCPTCGQQRGWNGNDGTLRCVPCKTMFDGGRK